MFYMNKNTFSIHDNLSNDEKCNDDYFEVDELIAPIIRVLNLKGYKTQFCCSGHYDTIDEDDQYLTTYITFADSIVIPSYPKDAAFELTNQVSETLKCTIRYHRWISNYEHDYYKIYDIIVSIMKEWLDWAVNLPEYNRDEALKSLFTILE